MKCPRCNNPLVEDSAVFCGHCGLLLNPRLGAEIATKSRYYAQLKAPPALKPLLKVETAAESNIPYPTIQKRFFSKPQWFAPRLQRQRSLAGIIIGLSCLLVAGLILGTFLYVVRPTFFPVIKPPSSCSTTATSLPLPLLPPDGIGVYPDQCGESIGLSDGRYILDAGDQRPGLALKEQAADKLRTGNVASAIALYNQAHSEDTSDAETLIYSEDQSVLSSGAPYVTFVIGTILPNHPVDGSSRDQLQGAYVVQKEYDDNPALLGGLKVRLLIAKSGSKSLNSITVAKQIVQAAQHDKTIIGILGWTKSNSSLDVIPIFTRVHIPLLSSAAKSDDLSGISKYFFHVTPLNKTAAPVLATYAQSLHPKRLIVLEDQQEPFSQNLAQDFTTQFNTNGYQVLATEQFNTGGSANELSGIVKSALKMQPDVFFMAANSASIYQNLLIPIYGLSASNQLQIITDSSIYPIVDNLQKRMGDVTRLHFLSGAFPDEWGIIKPSAKTPPFFEEYSQAFWYSVFPSQKQPPNTYGYTRADAYAMFAYDGLSVLLKGIQIAEQGKSIVNITPDDLQRSLTMISGPQAFQGITGQISFDGNHDPANRELLLLHGTPQGLQIEGHVYQGCFLVQDLLSGNCNTMGGA